MLAWRPIDTRTDPDPLEYSRDPADVIDAYAELVALMRRPWWHQHAACRGQGPSAWWPERGAPVEPLKAVCAQCPVADECRAEALSHPTHDDGGGIWGGTSARERRQIRRLDRAA